MKLEININEYLSNDEIKQAIIDEIKASTRLKMATDTDTSRIISNACYEMASELCDEQLNTPIKKIIEKKVLEIVNNLSSYTVFSKPDAWDRQPNNMYLFLQKTIEGHKGLIGQIVADNIEKQTLDYLKDDLKELIIESVQGLFIKK